MKKHVYYYDKIVLGGDLDAAAYALANDTAFIKSYHNPPLVYEKQEMLLWNQILFSLSLKARLPVFNEVRLVRIDEGGRLLVSTENNKAIILAYEELIVYDDCNIQGLTLLESRETKKEVLDWFDVKSGMSHNVDRIETDTDFVKEINFYPTERLDGVHLDKKDLVATSYMSDEELRDVEYSDSYVRLKTLSLMRENGIRGNSNGQGKHYALQIEHSKRQVKGKSKNKYKEENGIKFCSVAYKDVLGIVNKKIESLI